MLHPLLEGTLIKSLRCNLNPLSSIEDNFTGCLVVVVVITKKQMLTKNDNSPLSRFSLSSSPVPLPGMRVGFNRCWKLTIPRKYQHQPCVLDLPHLSPHRDAFIKNFVHRPRGCQLKVAYMHHATSRACIKMSQVRDFCTSSNYWVFPCLPVRRAPGALRQSQHFQCLLP